MTTPFGSAKVKSSQPPQPPKTQIKSQPPPNSHTANINKNTTTTRQRHNGHNGHGRQLVRPHPGDSNNESNDTNKATGIGDFNKKVGGARNTTNNTANNIYTSLLIFIRRKLLRSDRKLFQVLIVLLTVIIFSFTSIIRFSFYESNNNNNVNQFNVNKNLVTVSNAVKTLVIDSSSSIATPPPPLFDCDDKHGYESLFPRNHHKNQNNSTSNRPDRPDGPVFLWGIPSTTSDYEVSRRKLLRRTYLSFYRKLDKENKQHNRICSFHEWTCNEIIRQQCQMIYVFFIGGGNNETTGALPIMLNESIIDFRDMLLITPVVVDPNDAAITTMTNKTNRTINTDSNNYDINESGTVYLKIYENQFDGKMTTWFKFASLIAYEYLHDIDYIFKVDSDLLLLPPNFFNWFEYEHEKSTRKRKHKHKQKMIGAAAAVVAGGEEEEEDSNSSNSNSNSSTYIPPKLIYGGIEFPATNCVINYTFDHECPLPLSGRSYMSGELNFVSIDLATYITSDSCPRDSWTIPHEDVSISNYIYSYQNNTIYHNKQHKQQQQQKQQFESDTNVDNNDQDQVQDQDQDQYVIDIISVNTSRILLLPNMKSDWFPVNIKKNPEILLDYNSNDVTNNNRGTGTDSATTTTTISDSTASNSNSILWGHSIKRGEHKMYLYWKINSKYLGFWNRYSKIYLNRSEIIKKVIDNNNNNNNNNNTTRNGGGGVTNTSIIITTTATGGKNNNVQSNEDAIIKNHISEKLKQLRDKKAAAE